MFSAKMAAKEAAGYLADILGRRPEGLEIEEVEISDDEKWWYITLGYYSDPAALSRKYKTFTISSDTGEVKSMKIRTIQ